MADEERDEAFEALLEFVRDSRGFDYTSYKRPSLMRRFQKRMQDVGADNYVDYRALLERSDQEYTELFNTILINVTGFFRDPEAWEFLASDPLPKLVEQRKSEPIRVWSTGCATGEEAFTAAMLLAEALGPEDYRNRVKIYATDVDDDALTQGRHAVFSPRDIESVPEELRERYFRPVDSHMVFRSDLRRSVIFGRNDLLRDPPISRVDLLLSRNTLMYFDRVAQDRVVSNFFFSLKRDGFLFLGKAEALQSRGDLFVPYDLRRRIFTKSPSGVANNRYDIPMPPPPEPPEPRPEHPARESGFEQSPLAQLIVDAEGVVAGANQQARVMFGLTQRDIGRELHDLELSYRPLDLRSRIDEAYQERRPVIVREVPWSQPNGEQRFLDVSFTPLHGGGGAIVGVGISFTDISRYRLLQEEVEHHQRELETAYEELQSTVEELETTNEELQSTNEELETMNEELHSTNEELETMNEELRERTDDALQANAFLSSVLGSIEQSVVVVDPELQVVQWSTVAADLWGLRADEVEGQHFLNLDIGLPVSELRTPIREALAGGHPEPVALQTRDRRGRRIECTFSFSPLVSHGGDVQGVILVGEATPVPE